MILFVTNVLFYLVFGILVDLRIRFYKQIPTDIMIGYGIAVTVSFVFMENVYRVGSLGFYYFSIVFVFCFWMFVDTMRIRREQ